MSELAGRIAFGRIGGETLVQGLHDRLTLPDISGTIDPPCPPDAVVAVQIADPIQFIETVVSLHGMVAGMLLVAPALPIDAVKVLMEQAGATVLIEQPLPPASAPDRPGNPVETLWLMTTSGTTGMPKIVAHRLSSLSRSAKPPAGAGPQRRWGLLYEPSRFAGLQVVLQSLLGGGMLIVPDPAAELSDRIEYLAANGCNYLSATPSLWRKLLMLPASGALQLRQITLGGEIADTRLLTALQRKFPAARVTHIYASTEVGVGFAVSDCAAGFPLAFVTGGGAGVDLKIADGLLWARPPAAPGRGAAAHMDVDAEGYICTNDRVEIVGDRVVFRGRESSLVNIGGTKIQIEDVERIIGEHADVQACVVSARPNPILGAVLAVTVVPTNFDCDHMALKRDLKLWCKARLQREAVPASIDFAAAIDINAAGKVARV